MGMINKLMQPGAQPGAQGAPGMPDGDPDDMRGQGPATPPDGDLDDPAGAAANAAPAAPQRGGMIGQKMTAPGVAGVDPDSNPAYQQAMQVAMQALYGDEAARDVAKSIVGQKDVAKAIADTAYQMVMIVDEKTQGAVPDEFIISLATEILGEVVEIAEAAGAQVPGEAIAVAMRTMLLRYLNESGADSSQIEDAMSKIAPGSLGKLLDNERATTGAEA